MKIAILTLGTRGDVQPYAILGQALKCRGHEVVLSTAKNFELLVKSYGLDFVPVEADFQAMVESEEIKKIRKNPFLAKQQLSKFVYPMMDNAFTTFYNLALKSDKVLFHVKTMADNFADQFPEKMIRADVVPAWQPTGEFPNPVFSALHLPAFLNRATYKITEWGLKMWTKPVSDFRVKAGLPVKFLKPELPCIYGVSELLLSKPADFPKNSFFTGFWTEPSGEDLSPEVLQFIQNGTPLLVITFGSMPFDGKLDIKMLVQQITEKLNTRVILVRGWGVNNTEELEKNPMVMVINAAPYDKLFPLVKAVVHHGGIGTMAACLQAGRPVMACPILYPLGDQHFWGDIAYKKGVAVKPVPLKKLNYELFIKKVDELLTNETLYRNAQHLAAQLGKENGVANAVQVVEQML